MEIISKFYLFQLIETSAIVKNNTEKLNSTTKEVSQLRQTTEVLHDMNTNIALLVQENKHIAEGVRELKEENKEIKIDLEEIKSKPNRLLEHLQQNSLTYIITGIMAYLFFQAMA